MKNQEHRDLYKKLVDLRVNIKFLVCHSLAFKEEINKLERTEKRLKMIKERRGYQKGISQTNQEIRDTKLKIRECQRRNFG
jgi:hypothetical protein